MAIYMSEDFRRGFLRRLRGIEGLLQRLRARRSEEDAEAHGHVPQPSAGDQLAGAGTAEATHDGGFPGGLRDPIERTSDHSYNHGLLQDAEPVPDDAGSFDDGVFDGEYEEEPDDEELARLTEMVARRFLVELDVDDEAFELELQQYPEALESFREIVEFMSSLPQGVDIIEQVHQAVIDERLFPPKAEANPEGSEEDEPYHGSAAAIAGLKKQKYHHGLGDDSA
ncbi:hypothetical protein ACP70R_020439 [Stipagrostis hirtigluma subsp. patula]